LDVDGLAVSEHVGIPKTLSSDYPYTGVKAILPTSTEFPDPLSLIAALAASTTRLRFMTHILIAPLRHPILLAKEVATVAAVSGGRLDLGVGIGWMKEEFQALGIPFATRSSRLDEMLPLLGRLWTGEPIEHSGSHFRFEPFTVNPKPPSPVPILVGGHSAAAIHRAARLGDGWVGINPPMSELKSILEQLRLHRDTLGVRRPTFETRSGIKGRLDRESIESLRRLGLNALVVLPWQLVPKGVELTSDAVVANLPNLVKTVRED
jgi:probable F420-dependent oxidoreductase